MRVSTAAALTINDESRKPIPITFLQHKRKILSGRFGNSEKFTPLPWIQTILSELLRVYAVATVNQVCHRHTTDTCLKRLSVSSRLSNVRWLLCDVH